jgi:hypothetical protein
VVPPQYAVSIVDRLHPQEDLPLQIRCALLVLALLSPGCGGRTTNLVDDDGGSGDAPDGGVGDDGCPPYQRLCDGTCVATSVDPSNCGECGVECTGAEACSAGACSATCLTGDRICDNRCVDDKSDSQHCGGCDDPCEPGTGCVDGSCVPAVDLDAPPAGCAGGGPPEIGDGEEAVCGGDLAETTFRWALCSCTDIDLMNPLTTDAYASTGGSYTPGGLGGGVGLNGLFDSTSELHVWGDVWASSGPFATSNPIQIWQNLHVGGGVDATGVGTVVGDAYVGGDFLATNPFLIGETLHLPGAAQVSAAVTYASIARQPVSVDPPCDCAADQLIPIADYIAWARTSNDNVAVGLDPDVLNPTAGPTRLDLSCGAYFLAAVDATAPLVIAVHGRTALFVEGSIASTSSVTIALDPTAELNLFVGGTIQTTDRLQLGSASYPALTRVYLGGGQGLALSNDSAIGAYIYAAYGLVQGSDDLEIFGGVFAGDFAASGQTAIHYDREVLVAGEDCPDSDPEVPDSCNSCLDCGNQACIGGVCGECTDSSQCCSPLRCREGQCVSDSGDIE